MKHYISIDVGGTKVAYGLFDEERKLIATRKHPSDGEWTPDAFADFLAGQCREMMAESDVAIDGVAMAMPCFLDYKTGYVPYVTNLRKLRDFYPPQLLSERLNVPVLMDNDANVAALGEARTGAGKGFDSVIYTTVSTGIGAGLVLDGKIWHGTYGMAGEAGHMFLTPGEGHKCGCGNRGCFEAYCSGTNTPYHIQKQLDAGKTTVMLEMAGGDVNKIDGRILEEAVRAGDEVATAHLDAIGRYLGIYCYNLYMVLNVNCYVFGGGMSNMGSLLIDRIEKSFWQWNIVDTRPVHFLKSVHGGNVGIYGALELFFD